MKQNMQMDENIYYLFEKKAGKEAEVSNFFMKEVLNYDHPNIESSKRQSHGWSCWCGFHVFMKYAELSSQ